jgi:hypothetical protein
MDRLLLILHLKYVLLIRIVIYQCYQQNLAYEMYNSCLFIK